MKVEMLNAAAVVWGSKYYLQYLLQALLRPLSLGRAAIAPIIKAGSYASNADMAARR